MISTHVIKIASDTSNYGIKKNSGFIAKSKNKICGDKITVELKITGEIIKKMSYETESCIYCQASASLLSKTIKNTKIKKFAIFLDNIVKNKDFKQLLKIKSRNNCVMLPFDALQKAIESDD